MSRNRFVIIFCALLLLASLPFGTALAAPTTEGMLPPLPEQSAAVIAETISAARNTTCAIKTDGTLTCWGDNEFGQALPTTNVVSQVTMGYYHGCGLLVNGLVECWGNTANGELLGFPTGQTFTQISSGETHTCGIKPDGTLYCWGVFPALAFITDSPSGTFTQVQAGDSHTCAIRTNGTLACWGWGETNTGADPEYGQSMPPGGTFKQISAGTRFTCGIHTNGSVECWGYGYNGVAPPQPNYTAPTGEFTQISAGDAHVCATRTNGTVLCWGNTFSDNGSDQSPPNGMTFTQLTAGQRHTCGLRTDGQLICWGRNVEGQATVPAGDFGRSQLSAGFLHTCWLRDDGTIDCWGDDTYDQISDIPTGTFAQLSSDGHFTCAVKTDGTLGCWGDDTNFQVTNRPLDADFVQVSAGISHACAVHSDGSLSCWGLNNFGQALAPSGAFLHVSAGGLHTCGLQSDGLVACWGAGTTVGSSPDFGQSIAPGGTFTQVSAGRLFSCGLETEATLTCWGDNTDGATSAPSGTFAQLSAGGKHACAIKTDGTLGCWGNNDEGQATPPSGTFTQVTAGDSHTCGLKTGGKLVCWGQNSSGQSLPITVSGSAGAPGVTLSYTDDTAKTATSDVNGDYSFDVNYDWSDTVTPSFPSAPDVVFTPINRAYTNETDDQAAQDYDATVNISGNAGIADAILSYDDDGSQTVTADGSGNYTLAVSYDWSGTVTPSLTGYSFNPADRTYNNISTNQASQNYTAYVEISGYAGVPAAVLSYEDGGTQTATADGGGYYAFSVPYGWSGTVTPSLTGFTFSPANHTYSIILEAQPNQDYDVESIMVDISIGGSPQNSYELFNNTTVGQSYPGVVNGPVHVVGPQGGLFVTSQVVTSGSSYNELMGLSTCSCTTEYWFPYYDHGYPSVPGSTMRTWLAIGNPDDTLTAEVDVYIGGVFKGTYNIPPGGQATPRWIGLQDGPVQIVSTNAVNIFASQRVFTVPDNSFNESMGYPASQFTDEYWFPWYDSIYMNSSIMVGNTSSSLTAEVDIYIGTMNMGSYSIAHDDTLIQSYAGKADGPVRVESTNGVDIVVSQRVRSGPRNSYNELMAHAGDQFTGEFLFPWYDHGYPTVSGSKMRTWLAIGNPDDTLAAEVDVYIGGVLKGSYTIPPGGQATPRWIGLQDGPVQVISTNAVDIFASERVFTVPNSVFNEMMGYPSFLLSEEYWFPWYDSVNMNNSLLISRP
jgi:alpha-tubulin suppressor-like RCC1 family protein